MVNLFICLFSFLFVYFILICSLHFSKFAAPSTTVAITSVAPTLGLAGSSSSGSGDLWVVFLVVIIILVVMIVIVIVVVYLVRKRKSKALNADTGKFYSCFYWF
jgi:hypothetical protein